MTRQAEQPGERRKKMKTLMATLFALAFAFSVLTPAASRACSAPTSANSAVTTMAMATLPAMGTAPYVTNAVIPCGAMPFQADTAYMSLAGYQRYLTFLTNDTWISRHKAEVLVEQQAQYCALEEQPEY